MTRSGALVMPPRSRRAGDRCDRARLPPRGDRSLHTPHERPGRRRDHHTTPDRGQLRAASVSRGCERPRSRPFAKPPSSDAPSYAAHPPRNLPACWSVPRATRAAHRNAVVLHRRPGARRSSATAARGGRSRAELLATPAATALDDRTAGTGAHAGTEPVLALTAAVVGLESALHGDPVPDGVPAGLPCMRC
jgi:hypothetical protein